jgi:hypothetical protein
MVARDAGLHRYSSSHIIGFGLEGQPPAELKARSCDLPPRVGLTGAGDAD